MIYSLMYSIIYVYHTRAAGARKFWHFCIDFIGKSSFLSIFEKFSAAARPTS